jgi:EmrB/QacA subfamily drug resistance transporter
MVILDATIVNVALPAIRTDLGFDDASLQWVINAYTLVFGGFLLLGGRAADLLGRRRVFLAGLGLFGAASLAGGFAASEGTLVAARAVQGLGAAILSPAALSIVTTTFPAGRERNTALGVWGGLAGLGGTAGVVAGGLLVDGLGWEWVLFVNVPIAAVAVPLALRFVGESRATGARRAFDVAGAVTATGAALVLVYAVIGTDDSGWGSATTLGLLGASAALLAAFVAVERRSAAPLVPLRLFRIRALAAANAASLLVGASWVAMFFLTTLYMQDVLDMSALETGLGFVPMGVVVVLGAAAAGQLVTRVGSKPVFVAGAVATVAGLLLLAQIDAGGSYAADVLPGTLVFGLALPLCFVPNTVNAVAGVGEREAGVASGLATTSAQIGGAIGLAALATVATQPAGDALASGAVPAEALAEGQARAFPVGAVIAAANVVLALVATPGRTRTAPLPVGAPVPAATA